MRMRTIEISVGTFVLAGIVALAFLAVRVSGVNPGADRMSYTLKARFSDVAGLRERAKVSMAGVTVGQVTDIDVDLVRSFIFDAVIVDEEMARGKRKSKG